MTGITDALGNRTRLTYDGNDNLISLIDGEGRTITYTYDPAGRLTSRTNPLGETESYAYDLNDCLEAFTRGDGSTITYDYDKLNQLVNVDYSGTKEDSSQVLYAYDQEGRRLSMEDLTGTSAYAYDEAGRIKSITDGRGNTVSYEYDAFGNLSALTYPDGERVSYTYDLLERLTEVRDRQGGVTSYAYDPDGLLLEVKRPNGTKSILTYDGAGQIETIRNLDKGGAELSFYRYAYDHSGFITREEARQRVEGKTEFFTNTYTYDNRGQLASVSTLKKGKTSELRYTYDKAGNRITVEKNEDTVRAYLEEYAYDEGDRLISRKVSGNRESPALNGTTTYTYDKNGNLIQEIGPDERVTTYAYDVENRLKAVMEGERLLMAALYDGDGNRVFRMEYGEKTGGGFASGAEREETSASITQETRGEAGRSGSPLIPHAWETEEEQEEVKETRNNIFWYGFGQGLIQGLTTVPGYLSRWLHEHWEYILRRIEVHKDYEVHIFTEGGDEARKPKEGDSWTSTLYDEIFIPYQVGEAVRENYVETSSPYRKSLCIFLRILFRECRSKNADVVVLRRGFLTCAIGEIDRKYAQGFPIRTTSYVNDVNRAYAETLVEYQADGSATSIYEYGIQRLSYTDTGSGELFTYLYDGRGSVSNLTSQSGAAVLSYVYDAYGMSTAYNSTNNSGPVSGIGNPYGYNGEYTDPDTGFQYLRSRYYNSQTGSFLTEDTYSGSILEPLSQNRYTYTGNNPVNLADPSGHAWISGTAAKIAVAAGKATSKPGAVKSGAATAVKNEAKKAITSAKNTVSTSSQKSKADSKQNTSGGIKTAASQAMSVGLSAAKTSKSNGTSRASVKADWRQTIADSMNGTKTGTVRRVTPGYSYINNKLFTASSAKERKLCSNAVRATAGAMPTAAAVAPAIPGAFEGLWALLAALGGALAGAVGGAFSSVILPVVLVAAVAALGVGVYKYLSEEKVALTPTIVEQILEMARKKKEEQETIKVGPEDYDVLDKDGNVIYEGGGGSQNNNDDNGEEKPAPVEPRPESGGSSSENVPDTTEGNKTRKIWTGNDKYVPELANAIEARFPGQVKAVEREIFDANGNRITDLDIELEDIIIQVKSGSAKGLTRQMINTANATGKTVISYTPDQLLSSAVLRDVRSKGFKTFVDMESLLKFLEEFLGI